MMNEKILILASASPRRRRYLEDLEINYKLSPVSIDESPLPGEFPEVFVARMAKEKWRKAVDLHPARYVLAADTIVYLQGRIFGKPENEEDALRMLRMLRGKVHSVATSFVFGTAMHIVHRTVVTRVEFDNFSDMMAQKYVATGEPLDKAGAYGIQGKGAFLVKNVAGSYTNIVGLPLVELIVVLRECGFV